MSRRIAAIVIFFFLFHFSDAQSYPQNYFRHPLGIPMQLVANFGEIRANHWHMGLDIRTQQRVNLPVYAAADGYISRVSVEPGGFGQAIYISHPNGYTTLYGHLNSFFPALAEYVEQQQYARESWSVNLLLSPEMFPVKKGQLIARSGSTGASEGPHVHFEIRDSRTENNLNPLLFNFPVQDVIAPVLSRLAVYDRNHSTYEQAPRVYSLKKAGSSYSLSGNLIRSGSNKISFAIGGIDRLNGVGFTFGIYRAKLSMDGKPVTEFVLDNISYDDTRYINAQIDYPYKAKTGISVQHLTALPGAQDIAYHVFTGDGIVYLNDDEPHAIEIEVQDAYGNTSRIRFKVQYDESLARADPAEQGERFLPNNLNIFERDHFELFTTEKTIYDTIAVNYSETANDASNSVSPLFHFLSAVIPSHDAVTVRVKPTEVVPEEWQDRVIIKNVSGSRTYVAKAEKQRDWYAARFRQFGTFQAFIDRQPPTINVPSSDLSRASRIVFTPRDDFNAIKSFRAELDGHWLRFTNDKGRTWIYSFDEHFPRGEHELKVTVEDEAGNVTSRVWKVRR